MAATANRLFAKRLRRGACAALCGVLLASVAAMFAPGLVQARNPQVPTISMTVEAGFGGYAKRGGWIPLRVNISSNETTEGELVIDDGQPDADRLYAAISLPRNARRSVMLYARAKSVNPTVRFLLNGNELASVSVNVRGLTDEDRLVVVVSEPIDGYNFLGDLRTPTGGRTYVAPMLMGQLPDRMAALASVDQIIFNNVDTAQLAEAQRTALRAWVVSGGQIILGGGPGARLTANGMGDLSSARTVAINTTSAAALDSLHLYASSARPVNLTPIPTTTLNLPLAGLQITNPDAQVLIGAGETPLIVRRRIGRGLVDQLAFDITLAPLRDWPDRASAMNVLFGGRVSIPVNNGAMRSESGASIAARALPAARLPPFLLVAGFLTLYVLFIGPLNFLVLRRFKLYTLGWVTIPAITVLFTLIGLLAGLRYRGSGAQMHRLSVAYGDSQMVDGNAQSVFGLFAPRRMVFEIDTGRALVDGVRENPTPTSANVPFRLREGDTNVLREVLVSNSSTRSFYTRGEAQLPKISTELRLALGKTFSESARIEGTITNASNATLFDCAVIAGGDFQALPNARFGPGDKLNVALALGQRHNRPIIYPPTERMTQNGFTTSNQSFSGFNSQRLGKLFSQGNSLLDQLIVWRKLDARSGERRARELLGATLGDARMQINHGASLACWEDGDRSNVKTVDAAFTDHGLRIWELHVAPALAQQGDVVPADVMLWNVSYSSSSVSAGLGELRLDNGKHIVQYQPWVPLRMGSAESRVSVRLEFSSSTQRRMLRDTTIWVFDWQRREFVRARQLLGNATEEFTMQGNLLSPTGEMRLMFDAPQEAILELQLLRVESVVQ